MDWFDLLAIVLGLSLISVSSYCILINTTNFTIVNGTVISTRIINLTVCPYFRSLTKVSCYYPQINYTYRYLSKVYNNSWIYDQAYILNYQDALNIFKNYSQGSNIAIKVQTNNPSSSIPDLGFYKENVMWIYLLVAGFVSLSAGIISFILHKRQNVKSLR